MKGIELDTPQELIRANDLQRGGHYAASGKLYARFFEENPKHPLRFKCLFEVADNLYYEKRYAEALEVYQTFIHYCEGQQDISDEEAGWIDAYIKLANSRIDSINNRGQKI